MANNTQTENCFLSMFCSSCLSQSEYAESPNMETGICGSGGTTTIGKE